MRSRIVGDGPDNELFADRDDQEDLAPGLRGPDDSGSISRTRAPDTDAEEAPEARPTHPAPPWGAGQLPSRAVLEAHVRHNAIPAFREETPQAQDDAIAAEVAGLREQHAAGSARAEGAPPRPWDEDYAPSRSELQAFARHDVLGRRPADEVHEFEALSPGEQRRAVDHEVDRLQGAGHAGPPTYPWEAGKKPNDAQLREWVHDHAIPRLGPEAVAKFDRLPRAKRDEIVADMTSKLARDRERLWASYQAQRGQELLQKAQALTQLNAAWISFQTHMVSALAKVLEQIGHAIKAASGRG